MQVDSKAAELQSGVDIIMMR